MSYIGNKLNEYEMARTNLIDALNKPFQCLVGEFNLMYIHGHLEGGLGGKLIMSKRNDPYTIAYYVWGSDIETYIRRVDMPDFNLWNEDELEQLEKRIKEILEED